MKTLRQILKSSALVFCAAASTVCQARAAEGKSPKIGVIYTVTTPELKADMQRELRAALGEGAVFQIYELPEVFHEIRAAGRVEAASAAKMLGAYMKAVEDGADAVLSVCSTVADVAFAARGLSEYLGVPIVNVNDEMCSQALKKGSKIAAMATFSSSVEPTKRILERLAAEAGKEVEVRPVILEGAFGLEPEKFKALMAARAAEVSDWADAIIFTQGSMAYCEAQVAAATGKSVFSNPYWSAQALKIALRDKNLRPPAAKE